MKTQFSKGSPNIFVMNWFFELSDLKKRDWKFDYVVRTASLACLVIFHSLGQKMVKELQI